jgi:hypothetical protein
MNLDEIIDSGTWKLALQRWPVFIFALVASFLSAILVCAVVPHKFHVVATVIGTRYQSDITPSDQASSFSAAALLGSGTNDLPTITDFKLYTQLLVSPELGAAIVDDPVIHRVFWHSWDKDHWAAPDTFVQHVANVLFPLIGRKAWRPPDGFTVARYVASHVALAVGKDAKIATMGVWNADPQLGKDLLILLNTRADAMVKSMAQKRFQAKVEFLQKALTTATVQETRTALGAALAKAETEEIYSFSNLPFAAEFIAPPDSPSEPGFPDFWITLEGFTFAGASVFLTYIVILKRRSATIQTRASNRPLGEVSGAHDLLKPLGGETKRTA